MIFENLTNRSDLTVIFRNPLTRSHPTGPTPNDPWGTGYVAGRVTMTRDSISHDPRVLRVDTSETVCSVYVYPVMICGLSLMGIDGHGHQ